MPTYIYETIPTDPKQKPRRFEVEQRMSAAALTTDPESGLPVRRVITGGLGFIGAADKSAPEPGPCGMGGCGLGGDGPCGMGGECPMPSGGGHMCGPGCDH
jgi:hypothetical protein